MRHYQLLLSPHQVDLFRQGFDICGGFALPAEEVSEIRDIPTLLQIGQGTLEGAPYSAADDLFLLRVPAHPLIQARLACGPVDVRAVMGGVVEVPPFTGTGEVTFTVAGEARSCELYWMEPARVVDGTEVIRLGTDGLEQVELTYRGIELGWEDHTQGGFHVGLPSQFLGSMIARPWGTLPAEVHYVDDRPHHVTMLATNNPEYEEGFIQGENGLWAKELPYSSSLDLFQLRAMARYRNVPVAVLTAFAQPIPGQAFRSASAEGSDAASEQMVALVSPLIADSLLASQLGFERFTQGMFTATIPLSELTEQSMHEARPHSWGVAGRPLLTEEVHEPKDLTKPEGIINEILTLAANVAPEGWKQMRILAQVVGRTVHFAAMARIATGEGEALCDPITIPLLPTAIIHLCGQLKRVLATPSEGAPFTLLIAVDETGRVNFSADSHEEPHWAGEVPTEVWQEELTLYPRDEVPAWLTARLA